MADEVVGAPGGGAAAAAPAGGGGGSAPAVSAPASTAAPATSTPATGAPAEPVASAAPEAEPVRTLGESPSAFISRLMDWNDKQKKPTGEEKPVEPAKPAEAAKVAEPAKPAEVKPAEEVKNPLDDVGPLPASKVAEALKANPQLEVELEKAGIDKEALFTGLREAAAASQFRDLFGDYETAQAAQGAAETFQAMDNAATELVRGDMKSTQEFIAKVLFPLSYVQDDNGQPVMEEIQTANGIVKVPKTDGTVETLLDNILYHGLDQFEQQANSLLNNSNEQLAERAHRALDAIKEIRDFAEGKTDDGEEPEAIKTERSRLAAERQQIVDTKRKESETRETAWREDVTQATDGVTNSLITDFLSKTSLTDDPNDSAQAKESKRFIRESIQQRIRDDLYTSFRKPNSMFMLQASQIGRRGQSAATKQALVNLYKRSVDAAIEKVAAPILKNAGHQRVQQSAARAAKVAAQIKTSQTEPRGSTAPAIPTTPKVDEVQLTRDARAELIQEKGRFPTPAEILERVRGLKAKLGSEVKSA